MPDCLNRSRAIVFALAAILLLELPGPADAQKAPKTPVKAQIRADIQVTGAWARKPLTSKGNSAAFMSITNHGKADNRLTGVRSPAAGKAELHSHSMTDGIMRMRKVEGGIRLPAGQTVKLAPGGYHVMLMRPARPLEAGARLPLTLIFEKGAPLTLNVPILAAPPKDMPPGSPH